MAVIAQAIAASIASPQLQQRPAPIWSYLVADLRTGAILDELPLSGVRWSKTLNGTGSFTGTWQLGPAERRDAYTLTTPAKTAIYALRDGVPMWGGVVWTRRYNSATGTVDLGAGDFGTYFDHRKVVPFLLGAAGDVTYVAKQQVTFAAVDQNDIARQLIALAQSHAGGDIGIEVDTATSGILRDRTYFGYELQGVRDVIDALCNVIDGPDYLFDVAAGSTEQPRRVLRLGDPHLGQQGSSHVWEYGGNVSDYIWPSDGSSMTTRTYAVGDGIEQGALIAFSEDFDRYNNGWPLLESEAGYTTVTDAGTLNAHAQADLNAGRLPVALPTLSVRGDMAPFLGDYSVGDDARLVIPLGDPFFAAGLDTSVRLVQLDVVPESDSGEQVDLTCAPLLEDAI